MKIAVMADIHSNHIALTRCIAEAKQMGAEELGELAYPQRTLDILHQLKETCPCTFIRGNKEDYWIDHRDGKHGDWHWENGRSGSGMLRYAYDRLTPDQIERFRRMPISRVMQYKGMPGFTICHGSPFRANQSLREDYDYIDDVTKELGTELTLCAHFHIQTQYIRNGKRVVNPGSVGVPLKSGGKAQFMMLYDENGRWQTEFLSLDYDIDQVIGKWRRKSLVYRPPCGVV